MGAGPLRELGGEHIIRSQPPEIGIGIKFFESSFPFRSLMPALRGWRSRLAIASFCGEEAFAPANTSLTQIGARLPFLSVARYLFFALNYSAPTARLLFGFVRPAPSAAP